MLKLDLIVTKVGAQEIGKSATIHVATAGVLDLAKLHLTKNPVALTENSVVADITGAGNLPTYGGYAEQTVVWSAATEDDDGQIVFMGIVPEYRPSDSSAANLVKSLAVLNTAGNKVLMVANFPGAGVPMATALDNLIATLLWAPQGGGEVDVIS